MYTLENIVAYQKSTLLLNIYRFDLVQEYLIQQIVESYLFLAIYYKIRHNEQNRQEDNPI